MMKFIFTFVLLKSLFLKASIESNLSNPSSFVSQKNNFIIKAQYYINDRKIGTSQLRLMEGEAGSVELKDNFISVTDIQSLENQDGIQNIKMKFEIGHFDKEGKKIIIGHPSVITEENKLATLIFASAGGVENYKLEITPRKILK